VTNYFEWIFLHRLRVRYWWYCWRLVFFSSRQESCTPVVTK